MVVALAAHAACRRGRPSTAAPQTYVRPLVPACPPQNVLAKMVIERVPSVEMVRFVNSGTEACLSVVRLMRAYTGREKVRRRVPE